MITLEDLSATYSLPRPCALTIGSFDGVHLGHQRILQKLREKVGPMGTVCVLTFSNHPSQVLFGEKPAPLIFSKNLKLEALAECGVDVTLCIPFTQKLASKSYAVFLEELMTSCPFDFLVLGKGACLGEKKEGSPKKVTQLGKEMGFITQYIPKAEKDDFVISSGKIRELILSGNLTKASTLLGHPLMIEGEVQSQHLIIDPNICLPPDGEYTILVNNKKETIQIQDRRIVMQFPIANGKMHLAFC